MNSRRDEITETFLAFGEPVDTPEIDAEENPDFVRHRNLAYAYSDWRQGPDHEAAIYHLRQALALVPKMPKLWFHLGEWLREMGDREGAIAAYREVLKYDAAHTDAAACLKSLGST